MDKITTIRQTIFPTLNRRNEWDTLNTSERKALEGFKKDKNITILPADKGHMNKPDDIEKAQALLADTHPYQRVEIDPTPQLANRITQTLRRLKNAGRITKTDCMKMKPGSSDTPRFYRLPKAHSPDIPLRPIASLPGTPTHKLTKDLQQRLKHLVDGSSHSIHSTQQLLNNLKNFKINANEIMVSFDVTALFTSINISLAKETLATLLDTAETL
eukprot:g23636.t1